VCLNGEEKGKEKKGYGTLSFERRGHGKLLSGGSLM
jgi:hypothetical protein